MVHIKMGAVERKVKMACESTPEHGTFGSSDFPTDWFQSPTKFS